MEDAHFMEFRFLGILKINSLANISSLKLYLIIQMKVYFGCFFFLTRIEYLKFIHYASYGNFFFFFCEKK